jgi:hypothetical protein
MVGLDKVLYKMLAFFLCFDEKIDLELKDHPFLKTNLRLTA